MTNHYSRKAEREAREAFVWLLIFALVTAMLFLLFSAGCTPNFYAEEYCAHELDFVEKTVLSHDWDNWETVSAELDLLLYANEIDPWTADGLKIKASAKEAWDYRKRNLIESYQSAHASHTAQPAQSQASSALNADSEPVQSHSAQTQGGE